MTSREGKLPFAINEDRWAAFGPYYAMFPLSFVYDVVQEHSPNNGWVLDPFAGRGSSVFAAASLGRVGVGIEINSVGWIFGACKLRPAPERQVLKRLSELGRQAVDEPGVESMPEFFRVCYTDSVLQFLLTARRCLRWQTNQVDRTLMAFILVYLHGKEGQALSNQMRQSKAMSPSYCLKWREKNFQPPDIDPSDFLTKRIRWRYGVGRPMHEDSAMYFGDCTEWLPVLQAAGVRFDLIITSPPYWDVANYHYDQWLRSWLLGGLERPTKSNGPNEGKFESKAHYAQLIDTAFQRCGRLLMRKGVVYVRTDKRKFTFETTETALRRAFPAKRMLIADRPFIAATQTALYGDKSLKPGEVDIVMR